jgi:hypothetical protein
MGWDLCHDCAAGLPCSVGWQQLAICHVHALCLLRAQALTHLLFLPCCCSAKTKHLPRDVFGPPAPLEAKATFIAAIVNRAATGANFKNKVNSLYTELQRQQVAGGAVGLGARLGGPLPHLPARPGMGLQQRPGA